MYASVVYTFLSQRFIRQYEAVVFADQESLFCMHGTYFDRHSAKAAKYPAMNGELGTLTGRIVDPDV